MYCVQKKLHKRCLIEAVHSGTLVILSLALTMDFWSLWNLCYGFADFYAVQNYVPFRYQQSLSRCRCITCQDLCVQQWHAAKRLLP